MVRVYKKKAERMKYSEEDVTNALLELLEGVPLRIAAAKYSIPQTSLHQYSVGRSKSPRVMGRKTSLLPLEEMAIAQKLFSLADFGLVFDVAMLRRFVKTYLDNSNRVIDKFHNNLPGIDWARGFLKRHEGFLSSCICKHISRKRAVVTETDVVSYFARLSATLVDVPPANIINYDEMNLTDDSRGELMIFRKGVKDAERIVDSTKSSTSIMFTITAAGEVLQPYVVYKAESLQDSWTMGGQIGTHYNQTSSGWFDSNVFLDWFEKVVISYVKMLPADEPKFLFGDNLASRINPAVVDLCNENNIEMVFLPPNSAHFLQPLDVSVYGHLKTEWIKIITAWKEGEGMHESSFPNFAMPGLLLSLMQNMDEYWSPLVKAGFEACGIYPFLSENVLSEIRKVVEDHQGLGLVDFASTFRLARVSAMPPRRDAAATAKRKAEADPADVKEEGETSKKPKSGSGINLTKVVIEHCKS